MKEIKLEKADGYIILSIESNNEIIKTTLTEKEVLKLEEILKQQVEPFKHQKKNYKTYIETTTGSIDCFRVM